MGPHAYEELDEYALACSPRRRRTLSRAFKKESVIPPEIEPMKRVVERG